MDALKNSLPLKTYYIEETKDGMFNVFCRFSLGFGDKFSTHYIGGYDTREGAEALLSFAEEKGL